MKLTPELRMPMKIKTILADDTSRGLVFAYLLLHQHEHL